MKRIKVLLVCLLFTTTACNSKFEMSESDRVADHMMLEFAETVASKGLRPAGIGGGLNHATGKHKEFGISFMTQEKVADIDRARVLFVETADAFIDFINAREDIREYLDVFPVTILNIDIGIIFSNAQPGEIADVFNCKERLCYYTESAKSREEPLKKIHEETFEQAHSRLAD